MIQRAPTSGKCRDDATYLSRFDSKLRFVSNGIFDLAFAGIQKWFKMRPSEHPMVSKGSSRSQVNVPKPSTLDFELRTSNHF